MSRRIKSAETITWERAVFPLCRQWRPPSPSSSLCLCLCSIIQWPHPLRPVSAKYPPSTAFRNSLNIWCPLVPNTLWQLQVNNPQHTDTIPICKYKRKKHLLSNPNITIKWRVRAVRHNTSLVSVHGMEIWPQTLPPQAKECPNLTS